MKRLIAALLLIILCVSCIASLAEEEKELTCQGIPWFSSPEEASTLLVESGFIKKGFSENDLNKSVRAQRKLKKNGNFYYESCIGTDPGNKKCPYAFVSDKNPSLTQKLQTIMLSNLPKTIAKQEISLFTLYFTPDPDKPQLVECNIAFKAGSKFDSKAVLNALKEAYGKPTSDKNKTYTWLGGNNTIVLFYPKRSCVSFASLDGLELAESYDIDIPGPTKEPDDTGF